MDIYKLTHNKNRDVLYNCMNIVEQFIDNRKLIIYGGFAIDAALREHGQCIYEDVKLEFADYDFFSSDLIKDAYDLAVALSNNMNSKKIDIINAMHMRTMRVSYEGIIVADISYCPHNVFTKIKTLSVESIRKNRLLVVHPLMQSIDIHSALSMPFSNPPMEVYKHRLNKDIERYNMMYDTWLVRVEQDMHRQMKTKNIVTHTVELDVSDVDFPLVTGLINYARLVRIATARTGYSSAIVQSFEVHERKLVVKIRGYANKADKIYGEVYVASDKCSTTTTYNRMMDVFYEYYLKGTTRVYVADKTLYPATTEGTNGIYYSCVQDVLKNLLAHGMYDDSTLHMQCYFDLLHAMKDCSSVEFFIGDQVWPSIDAPNISDTLDYWNKVIKANVDDRKRLGSNEVQFDQLDEVQRVLGTRPVQLMLSTNNFEAMSTKFLQWDYLNSPYFMIDGKKKKVAN